MITLSRTLIALVVMGVPGTSLLAQRATRTQAVRAMRQAAEFYDRQVATHGGYVYHYSLDLSQRWGEGPASKAWQIEHLRMNWRSPLGIVSALRKKLRCVPPTGSNSFNSSTGQA